MGLARIRQERQPESAPAKNGETLSLPRAHSVESILLSYSKLPQSEITPVHIQHFLATRNVLWNAVDTYGEELDDILSQSRVSNYNLQRVTGDFHKVIDSARRLDFPAAALKPISFEFIDASLDQDKALSPHIREAVAEMGLAIGHDKIFDAKVRHIARHHLGTIESAQSKALSSAQQSRAQLAENMLNQLGVTINVERVPSVINNITEFTKDHARSVTMTGAAALISASVLAPNIANASEVPVSAVSVSSSSTTSGSTLEGTAVSNLVIGSPNTEAKTPTAVGVSTSTEAPVSATVRAQVGVTLGGKADEKQPSVAISEDPTTALIETHTPVTVTIDAKPEAAPVATITITTPTPESQVNANAQTIVDTDNIQAPDESIPEDGQPVMTNPITIGTTPENAAPKLDKDTATPEQMAIQTITDTINNDGDIPTASTLIRMTFHDKNEVVTSYKNGQPVYEITNPALVKDIITREATFEDLISKSGHADANYVNTALTALSVFDAAANDQSVLASPDIQKLLAGVVKPTDEYQGKLFDQYAARAKEMLEANNSALLTGINDQYKAQVETMYAYILLANVTDTDQAAQIQQIKTDEASAAAAAAAAEAAKGTYSTTPEADAAKSLIDGEKDPAKQRTYMAFSYLMTKGGLTPTEAAGVIGNLLVESASTMDPSIQQFGGGPAAGIAQWEAGRLVNLKNYAASVGKPWDDLYTQLDFLLSELAGRQNTLERIKGTNTVFDATNQFMIHFETPAVVVNALKTGNWDKANAQAQIRAGRGQPILDAFNAGVKTVNDTREAAAKAEAERKAQMGMSLAEGVAFVANYKNNPDNIKYIGESGTHCNGGPLSNCTSFSVYFVNKYTDFGGMVTGMPGNGSQVAGIIAARNPGVKTGTTPEVDAIFSTASGSQLCNGVKCGHTGVILGVDKEHDIVIVGEAGCGAASVWDTARQYSYAQFNSGKYTYVYTDGHLKTPVN